MPNFLGALKPLTASFSSLLTLECDKERRKVKGEASRMNNNYLV
jgi:hypothetical protein